MRQATYPREPGLTGTSSFGNGRRPDSFAALVFEVGVRIGVKMEAYETPQIVELGTLAEITQANVTGDFLDDTFPVGTPQSELTFTN